MTDIQLECKKGPLLIRISAKTFEEIKDLIDDAIDLLKIADAKFEETHFETRMKPEELREFEGIPQITSPGSISDAISQLMASDWGKTPRSLSDIMDALETNAIFYNKKSVTVTLSRMTKSNILRRIKRPEGYHYVPGKALKRS